MNPNESDLIKNNVTLPIDERKLMNILPIFTNNIQNQKLTYYTYIVTQIY